MLALLERSARHHMPLRRTFERHADEWVLPWAILPELDYMTTGVARGGGRRRPALRPDGWQIAGREAGEPSDLTRALELDRTHPALTLGLVGTVVMAVAERLGEAPSPR